MWYFQGPSLERLAAYLATAAGLFALDLFTRGAGGDDPSKAHDKVGLARSRRQLDYAA